MLIMSNNEIITGKFRNFSSPVLNISQKWNKEEIFVKDANGRHNCHESVQLAAGDSDIYETLKKYNMLPTMENMQQFLRSDKAKGVYADITSIPTFVGDIIKQQELAEESFNKLPTEIKEIFDNNKYKFAKEGAAWLKQQFEKIPSNNKQPKEQPKEQQGESK